MRRGPFNKTATVWTAQFIMFCRIRKHFVLNVAIYITTLLSVSAAQIKTKFETSQLKIITTITTLHHHNRDAQNPVHIMQPSNTKLAIAAPIKRS